MGLLGLFRLTLLAHEGEEFAIILPIIMLLGAFFIMRWANQKDKSEEDQPPEDIFDERPVGLVLPRRKTDEVDAREDVPV